MAVLTLGTTANNSIAKALLFTPGGMDPHDVATLNNAIVDDLNPAHPRMGGGQFTQSGLLFLPRRGYLQLYAGDYVGVSTRGFPYLVSADDIASGTWVHS